MTLHCETEVECLSAVIAVTLRSVCNLRGEIEFVTAGTLAKDDKVIDAVRSHEYRPGNSPMHHCGTTGSSSREGCVALCSIVSVPTL